MKIVVTGANGHLGRRLMAALVDDADICAVVRRESARAGLVDTFGDRVDVLNLDYTDVAALTTALEGADVVVHLVGILKETRGNSYVDAHERAAEALIRAAESAGAKGIVYLSILGSESASRNDCLASRGRTEALLLSASIPSCILQVPMVLGEGDFASRALANHAKARVTLTFRKQSREQPIYAGDVVAAIAALIRRGIKRERLQLAGPTSLTRADLMVRAGRLLGHAPVVISLPIALGFVFAAVLELLPNPPVTRAMLGVLDHDDEVDPGPVTSRLGLSLTSLDEMLKRVLQRPV